MKREDKQMILIYSLIFLIIVLIIFLTKIILENNQKPKETPKEPKTEETVINPYPVVNEECTFSVTRDQYHQLTAAGCKGGYTRYDINDVNISPQMSLG